MVTAVKKAVESGQDFSGVLSEGASCSGTISALG